MNKPLVSKIIALVICINTIACDHARKQTKTLAELIEENSKLETNNHFFAMSLRQNDSIIKHSDSMNTPTLKPYKDYMLLVGMKADSLIRILRELQLQVFFLADHTRLHDDSQVSLPDLKHPDNFEETSGYFYGRRDDDTSRNIAHNLRLTLEQYCTILNYPNTSGLVGKGSDTAKEMVVSTIHYFGANSMQLSNGNIETWQQANFKNATAKEVYVFLEKLKFLVYDAYTAASLYTKSVPLQQTTK